MVVHWYTTDDAKRGESREAKVKVTARTTPAILAQLKLWEGKLRRTIIIQGTEPHHLELPSLRVLYARNRCNF